MKLAVMQLHTASTCAYSGDLMLHSLSGSFHPAVLLRSHSLHAYDQGHILSPEFTPYWGFSRREAFMVCWQGH